MSPFPYLNSIYLSLISEPSPPHPPKNSFLFVSKTCRLDLLLTIIYTSCYMYHWVWMPSQINKLGSVQNLFVVILKHCRFSAHGAIFSPTYRVRNWGQQAANLLPEILICCLVKRLAAKKLAVIFFSHCNVFHNSLTF